MLYKTIIAIYFIISLYLSADASVNITINADHGRIPISPWIYGRNNSISDDPDNPVDSESWLKYKDANVRIYRENWGNNSTKYNWSRKLSSHPDWYNNVYDHDWDYEAQSLLDNTDNTQAIFAFQLLGKAAANKDHNFNDWEYNNSRWWTGVRQNLAGGGTPDTTGGEEALIEGDPNLYLMDWPAESTTAILDHWFGSGGLGMDKERFVYWNMDNEPEVWSGTHDDAMPVNITAEEYMQKYFAVAKLAREKYPEIKLLGPVFTNEWQWYNWDGKKIESGQESYTWVEFFIKRIAEEEAASGIKLLDVLDFHFYPNAGEELTLQLHRIWFDTSWNYPKANGCKRLGASDWDVSIKKEYIFERCNRWLEQYMGKNHSVKMGSTEMGSIYKDDPNVVACWYASHLGTFADKGVEVFTPWEWHVGMWEVLHLFSNYAKNIRVSSYSTEDTLVSAYSSLNNTLDSMTIILVNRDKNADQTVDITVNGFILENEQTTDYLRLADLPSNETFVSHTDNALISGTVDINDSIFSLSLPPYSITAVLLKGQGKEWAISYFSREGKNSLYFNYNKRGIINFKVPQEATFSLGIYSIDGKNIKTLYAGGDKKSSISYDLRKAGIANGVYFIKIKNINGLEFTKRISYLN